jgi:hypothetical protein
LPPERTPVAELLRRIAGEVEAGTTEVLALEARLRDDVARDLGKVTWAELAQEEGR